MSVLNVRLFGLLLCIAAFGSSVGSSHALAQAQQSEPVPTPTPDTCQIQIKVDDTLRFDPAQIEVPAACERFTVLLSHVGRLPKVASPRNWVLTKTEDANAVARDAELAGVATSWVKLGDARVLAASTVIGRGETVRVDVPVAALAPGVQYTYLSTIPGFSPILRGTLTVLP